MDIEFKKKFQVIRIIICVLLWSVNSQYILSSSKYDSILKLKYEKKIDKLWPKFYFLPYILQLKHKKGKIFYYGSYHNVDLEHPQFQDIEDKWNIFKPDVAFSEGEKWPLVKSREDSIKKFGEQGLLRYLAFRDNVKIKCIEPKRRSEMLYLLKQFSPSKIKIYYVLRQIIIDREIFEKDLDAADYVKRLIMNMSWGVPFDRSPNTIGEFSMYIKKYLPDLKNWTTINSNYFMNITRPNNFLARINVLVIKYRDQFMVKKIMTAIKKGKKIFFVVGKSHVLNQEKKVKSKIHEL